MDSGRIQEQGTHDELIAKNGIYAALVANQKLVKEEDIVTTSPLKTIQVSKSASTSGTEGESHLIVQIGGDSQKKDGKSTESKKILKKPNYTKRFFMMNKPEWHLYVFGYIEAVTLVRWVQL